MMTLYIATPINARKGKSMKEKLVDAKHRIEMLREILADDEYFKRYGTVSTFDINQVGELTEEEAMGRCIELVLKCDAIYLDHGWQQSKGCNLEYRAAKIYGLKIYEHDRL